MSSRNFAVLLCGGEGRRERGLSKDSAVQMCGSEALNDSPVGLHVRIWGVLQSGRIIHVCIFKTFFLML